MTKQDKLIQLDTLVLDRMLKILKSKKTEDLAMLSDLSVPMNYLRNNQVVSEKAKSSVEEDTKKRLAEAQKRREEGQSK